MPKQDPARPSAAPDPDELRGQTRNAHFNDDKAALAEVIEQTTRLSRKHHLDYDQTKYVVEQASQRLELSPPRERQRTVERLDWPAVDRLIQAAYSLRSTYVALVKTLFYTGTYTGGARSARPPGRARVETRSALGSSCHRL